MTEEEKIICKQFLNDADKTHSCNEYKLLMALLEQEPTPDDCENCIHNKGVLECDMYGCKYEPTTKNDLGVDAVSRANVLKLMQDNWHIHNGDWAMQESMDDIRALPSVTPIRPKGHWEHGKELCREYQGKTLVDITYKNWHCSNCHCVIEQSEKPKWNFCPRCGSDNGKEIEVEA